MSAFKNKPWVRSITAPVGIYRHYNDLAYECSCGTHPPCNNCAQWCERCEGGGEDLSEIKISVTIRGRRHIIFGELLDCPDCDGYGTHNKHCE